MKSCLALLLLSSLSLRAGAAEAWKPDVRMDLDVSYPPTAFLSTWMAMSKRFQWVPKDLLGAEAASYTYGYIRPHVRLVNAFRITQLAPRLDFYPVSFFGVTAGFNFTHSSLNELNSFDEWSGYNCDRMVCRDWIHMPFVESKFKWAYPKWHLVGTLYARRDWATSQAPTRDWTFESESILPFRSKGDRSTHYWAMVGTDYFSQQIVGFRVRSFRWEEAETGKLEASMIYNYAGKKPWNLSLEARRTFRIHHEHFNSLTLRASYLWGESPEAEAQ